MNHNQSFLPEHIVGPARHYLVLDLAAGHLPLGGALALQPGRTGKFHRDLFYD